MTRSDRRGWILGNLLVAATAGYALVAHRIAADHYYLISQEDRWVEWSTVWAFLMATLGYAITARHDSLTHRRVPWFAAGLAVFCWLVAMEEMSWVSGC